MLLALVIKRDKNVFWRFLWCSSPAVYDTKGHSLGLCDVIWQTASGVKHKSQNWGLSEAHQSKREKWKGNKDLSNNSTNFDQMCLL